MARSYFARRALRTAVSLASVAAFQPFHHGLTLRNAACACSTLSSDPRASELLCCAAKGGAVVDAEGAASAAAPIHLPTNEESDQLLRIRHTTAHVMAMAVQRLFKDAKVTIGPWIDKGFYYDFDKPTPFLDKDLRRIKKEMDKLITMKLPLVKEEVSAEEAERRIREADEPYKLEILESIIEKDPTAPITIYHVGDRWWDLCAGPHVEHTGLLPKEAIALESIAGPHPTPPCPTLHHPTPPHPTPPFHPYPTLLPLPHPTTPTQAPTGGATSRVRCCSASTAPRGRTGSS